MTEAPARGRWRRLAALAAAVLLGSSPQFSGSAFSMRALGPAVGIWAM